MAQNKTTEDDTALCRRVAAIMGPQSGAAMALARYEELTKTGYRSGIRREGSTWFVLERDEVR